MLRHSFYGDNHPAAETLKSLIQAFEERCREYAIQPLTVFIPMKDDLIFCESENSKFTLFCKDLSKIYSVLDLTSTLKKDENVERLYRNSHLTEDGNKICANAIREYLMRK